MFRQTHTTNKVNGLFQICSDYLLIPNSHQEEWCSYMLAWPDMIWYPNIWRDLKNWWVSSLVGHTTLKMQISKTKTILTEHKKSKQVMWLVTSRSKAQVHVCMPVCGAPWWVLLQHSIMLWLFFIVKCGIVHFLCAMHVFEVQASSSSSRLPLCQISFLSQPPLLS